MTDILIKALLILLALTSLFSIILTAYDKRAAKKGGRRISERTLLTLGFFGGAFAMLLTMKAIRHKTKHKRFMIGLPFMLALHVILIALVYIST